MIVQLKKRRFDRLMATVLCKIMQNSSNVLVIMLQAGKYRFHTLLDAFSRMFLLKLLYFENERSFQQQMTSD